MIERTLVLIKPDGVQRGLTGEIIKRFENVGLKIVGMKMTWINEIFAEKHYSDIKARRGEKVFNA
ncbi:MAG: nucleoside-diphosphate kinase, partial [archaeon]